MRNKPGKRNIIAAVAALVALFALLGLTLHFIESRGIVSGQLGDTGEWGDEDDFTYFTLDGEDYLSRDRLETYLICGTDSGGEDEGDLAGPGGAGAPGREGGVFGVHAPILAKWFRKCQPPFFPGRVDAGFLTADPRIG
jgi:hypothetical protein